MMKTTVRVCAVSLCLVMAAGAWAQNRAGLLIQNSNGETISRCVEFAEASITVEALLERSGFRLVTQDSQFGSFVCFLHDDGVESCDPHPDGWFWNFFVHEDGAWASASEGISSVMAEDGDLFGFGFGAFGEVTLPEASFDLLCFENQAGLAVYHGDGSRVIRLVDFFGETITGFQLLQKSGLDYVASETSFGVAICAIDGEGHPADNCFGDFTAGDPSWGLSFLNENDEWVSSPVGVGDSIVYGGDVQGWLFGQFGDPLPAITREEIFVVASSVSSWELMR